MPVRELLHRELSYELQGILFTVHNEIGRFGREKQYGDLFEQRLKEKSIQYHRELRVGDTGNIVDFLIEEKVVVEFKSKAYLMAADYDQIKRYLDILNLELGILINFRSERLNPKRILRRDRHP